MKVEKTTERQREIILALMEGIRAGTVKSEDHIAMVVHRVLNGQEPIAEGDDIMIISEQGGVSRSEAILALVRNDNDMGAALMHLI